MRSSAAAVVFLLQLLLLLSCARQDDASAPAARDGLAAALRTAAAVTDSLLASADEPDAEAAEHRRILAHAKRLGRSSPEAADVQAFLDDWRAAPQDIRLLDLADRCRPALEAFAADGGLPPAPPAGSQAARFLDVRGDEPEDHGDVDAWRSFAAQAVGLSAGETLHLQLRLADLEEQAGDPEAAFRCRLESLPELHRLAGPSAAGRIWYDVAMALLGRDALDMADQAADRLARCAEAVGAAGLRFRTTYVRGCLLDRRTRYDAALDTFAALEERARAKDSFYWQNRSISRQVLVERARGDLSAALEHTYRSRSLALDSGRWDFVAARHTVIAGMHRALGRLDSARVHIEIAAALAANLGIPRVLDLVDQERQLYALQIGDYAQADSLTAELLARPEIQSDPSLVRDLKLDLMTFGLENDRPDLAYRSLQHLRSQAGITRISTDYDARLWLALRAAELYARQGEFAAAAVEMDSVTDLAYGAVGAPDVWLLEQTRGRVAELMDDPATAEEHYRTALAAARELANPDNVRRSRVGLGQVLIDQGRHGEARALFAEALDAPEFLTAFQAALFTGQAFAADGRHAEALEAYTGARSLITPDVSPSLRERVAVAEAVSLAALGRRTEAWRRLQEAPPALERRRDADNAEILQAFHHGVQHSRAELTLSLLHDDPALVPDGGAVNAALNILTGLHGEGAGGEAAPVPVTDGDLVLWTFLGRDRGFACIGSAAGWRLRELTDLPDLRRLANDVTADMARSGAEIAWDEAGRLTDVLLGADLGLWAPGGTLTLAVDGVLQGLPWPALPLPDGGGQFVDRGPLRHATGARGRPKPAGPAAVRLLALGADGLEAGDDVRLREAAREAREVASLFPAGTADVLVGTDADWDAMRLLPLADYGVIHIATHARVSLGRRGGSTLRLTAGGRDRPVTAVELRELPVRADLVYLSCCEGAGLAVDRGSGVDSLARSFLQAGARAVVASVLATDDEASRLLAGRFYEAWLAGEAPAAALRSAQRSLRDGGFAHPCWWAFQRVLVTDGS